MDKTLQGIVGGPLLGLFLLGLFTTRATASGAEVGTAVSCLVMAVVVVSAALCGTDTSDASQRSVLPDHHRCPGAMTWLGHVSFFWYPALGAATTFLVGWLTSLWMSWIQRLPPKGSSEHGLVIDVSWLWRRQQGRRRARYEMVKLDPSGASSDDDLQ